MSFDSQAATTLPKAQTLTTMGLRPASFLALSLCKQLESRFFFAYSLTIIGGDPFSRVAAYVTCLPNHPQHGAGYRIRILGTYIRGRTEPRPWVRLAEQAANRIRKLIMLIITEPCGAARREVDNSELVLCSLPERT